MTHLLTVRACEQTPGDLAIMAEFPEVFTTGTQRIGVPAEGRTKGDGENLPVDFTKSGKKC
jgi:hypothetical protein